MKYQQNDIFQKSKQRLETAVSNFRFVTDCFSYQKGGIKYLIIGNKRFMKLATF